MAVPNIASWSSRPCNKGRLFLRHGCGQTAYQKGEYFRRQLAVTNTSATVWQSVTVASPGQSNITGNAYVPRTPENYSYDADGNLLSDGRWTYTWDAENRSSP